ncbi:MAG: MarR family winged helix-turn-helix transcriptional regulator [Acutalibacteraceae bacterium]|nr:MarR family winged helix-turn-helix transcriptional regulator [Oscillospiraceae bacterium]
MNLDLVVKISKAYSKVCKSLCRELKLPQTAFDILMFLANNPKYKTASDVVEIRKLKANLVSVNVDKLVNEGYLRREAVEGDRRKTRLVCTQKAQQVIEKGRELQSSFFELSFKGIDEKTRKNFFETLETVSRNLETVLKEDN